jgi:hypothetical protein
MTFDDKKANRTDQSARALDDTAAVHLDSLNGSRRLVYTPAVIELVRQLAGQGRSAAEIATVIGSTAATVRVKCCQLQIKLSKRGRQSQRWFAKIDRVFGARRLRCLNRKAAYMQKSPIELAGMLLEAIVGSNLYEAVLDPD